MRMKGEVLGGVGGGKRSKSPKVQWYQGPGVPRTKISQKSHSNMSFTLKKVHFVVI